MKQKLTIVAMYGLLVLSILLSNLAIAQVYNTVKFQPGSSAFPNTSSFSNVFCPLVDDTTCKTFELWCKHDTLDNLTHYLLNLASTTSADMLEMYITDSTLTISYAGAPATTHIAYDTMWHHIAYVVLPSRYNTLTHSNYDSACVYIDGALSYSSVLSFNHSLVSDNTHNMSIGHSYSSLSGGSGQNIWYGNMAKVAVYDTALYTSNFTPDCVYDTTFFWDIVNHTVSSPCIVFVPLNGDINAYFSPTSGVSPNIIPLVNPLNYSFNNSPCAPTYIFYCPATDTITYTGTDTVLKAVNTNASYIKGAHLAIHKNGWLNPSTTIADFTTGIFTDTLITSSPNIYPYISSYSTDTDKVIVVIHDTTATGTSVPLINQTYSISIFPNPTNNFITIQSEKSLSKVELVNMLGQVIFSVETHADNSCSFDLSNYKPGIYLLKVNDAYIKRIIKD